MTLKDGAPGQAQQAAMEAVGSVDALSATIHELNTAAIAQEEEHGCVYR